MGPGGGRLGLEAGLLPRLEMGSTVVLKILYLATADRRCSGVGLAEKSRGLEPSVNEVADHETDYADRCCPPDGPAEAHPSARLPNPGLAEQPRLLFPLGPTDVLGPSLTEGRLFRERFLATGFP